MSINWNEISEGGETNPREKREKEINRNLNLTLDLCRSSNPVSNTGGLIVKDNDNIFIKLCAREIGSVLCGKTMKKNTKKSLNANWCNSSTNQKEEKK